MRAFSHQVAGAIALVAMSPAAAAGGIQSGPESAEESSEPSPEAIALARMLAPERVLVFSLEPLDHVRARIEQQLLNTHYAARGTPCDPENAECVRVARELAEREAPLMLARMRTAFERIAALRFDSTMTREELRAAQEFVRQGTGRKLADALMDLAGMRMNDERLAALVPMVMREMSHIQNSALSDEYYDRTSHLPRARLRMAPPPPPSPSPPRRN